MKPFLSVNHSHLVRSPAPITLSRDRKPREPGHCLRSQSPYSGRKWSSSGFLPKNQRSGKSQGCLRKWKSSLSLECSVSYQIKQELICMGWLLRRFRHGHTWDWKRTTSRLRTEDHRSHFVWNKANPLKGCKNLLPLDFSNYRLLISLVCKWVHSKRWVHY